jgi:hypothetical protein
MAIFGFGLLLVSSLMQVQFKVLKAKLAQLVRKALTPLSLVLLANVAHLELLAVLVDKAM